MFVLGVMLKDLFELRSDSEGKDDRERFFGSTFLVWGILNVNISLLWIFFSRPSFLALEQGD